MQIIGFNFDKIHAEKKKALQGKVEIKSNIQVKDISEEKVALIKDKDVLKFDFEFSIDYTPGFAELILQGSILAIIEKDKVKEILKKWKSKKVSEEIRIPLFNLILTKCSLKALQFEEEFQLPPHIPLPKVANQQDNQNYVQ
jgi:hypothetical protein